MAPTIEVTPADLHRDIRGADRLWALKSQLRIPLASIISAEPAVENARRWLHGMRLGGTHIPSRLSAGRFYDHGEWTFWDVHDAEKAIAIGLRDQRYARVIVEVGDPDAAIAQLRSASRALAGASAAPGA